MNRSLAFFCVLLFGVMVGCGGSSGLPPSQSVTATLTPQTATIAPGGSVVLQAQTSGFTSTPYLFWVMQEQHNAGATGSENCDGITAANQELIPTCKFGYIVVNAMAERSSTATYFAPPTPGTYHVVFRALQMSTGIFGGSVEKDATATITVQ